MGLDPGQLHILACGPYFNEAGVTASIVLFLFIKPLSYFAYIRAFRYRVCSAIPMTVGQTVKLAALRAGIGFAFVGTCYWALETGNWTNTEMSWAILYVVRIVAWWIVGLVAKLRGWRMLGWIVGGEAINVAFDLAVITGLAQGALPAVVATVLIAGFIAVVEWRGRRPELLSRFSTTNCRNCTYNLTGNLSGICPECGTPIAFAPATV